MEPKQILSNTAFDILKWVAMIALPAIGTTYFALAGIWGWPYAEQIVGTLVAVNTLLGILLGVSNAQYKSIK